MFQPLRYIFVAAVCTSMQAATITIDTTGVGSQAFIEFQLVKGSGDLDAPQSTVKLRNFVLTGASWGDVFDPTLGNAIGTTDGILTLNPGPASFGSLADYVRALNIDGPSGQIVFSIEYAITGIESPIPDRFTVLLLDPALHPFPTLGPTGVEVAFSDFGSVQPQTLVFPGTNGTFNTRVSEAPEPSTVTLILSGGLLVGVGCLRRRRGQLSSVS